MLAKSKQTKIRIAPLARIPHDKPDAPACSSTDFSLCAFPRIPRKSKPHRLNPVLLEPRMRLLNNIADALASSTDFSLSAFPRIERKSKAHRLKPVLRDPRVRLLNHIADAAGHRSGAGVEQAEIIRARPFRAHRRSS